MSERCENPECKDPQVRFLYNEKNQAIYQCCFSCHSARAVKKSVYYEKTSGSFQEFRDFRDAYYKDLWETARSKNLERIRSNQLFYDSPEWRKVRYQALLLNGRQCQCCGAMPPKAILHVDHIRPRSLYPELALEPTNLQVLCSDCNRGKSNRDETDFRANSPDPKGAA